MSVKIKLLDKITDDVLLAFKQLMPQLDENCVIPNKSYLLQIIQSSNTFIFIAEEDNIIVGTLTLLINQIPTGQKAWIEDVVVDSSLRGKGIGKSLIQHAIEFAKRKGIAKIDLTSRPERVAANELYKKLGFEKRDTNIYRLTI